VALLLLAAVEMFNDQALKYLISYGGEVLHSVLFHATLQFSGR
jgi:hypothetical protein